MTRKVQLLELVAQLRAETGRTQNVAAGVGELDNLKAILRRVQKQLYEGHDWAHMRVQKTLALAAGQRYYTLPTGLNFDRIESVKLNYNNQYFDIDRYIDITDYSAYDSNATVPVRSNPALKWDIRYTGSTEQLEIWPIPNDNTQTLYFTGFQTLSDLVQDADRADLDDVLIILYAAAEMLARQGSKDAQSKQVQADKRLGDLLRNSAKAAPMIQMGLGGRDKISSNRTVLVVGG